jgi:uncharacterized Fe-S cluster-containing protein
MSSDDIKGNVGPSIDPSVQILELLPGFNCNACGYSRCDKFVEALLGNKVRLKACVFLIQEQFMESGERIKEILEEADVIPKEEKLYGVIDGYEADFSLGPLPEENSCREILYPLDDNFRNKLKEGDIIRYRPFGCPIIHFAQVMKADRGLIVVHIKGPRHRFDEDFDFLDIGICLVCGFEGIVKGKLPRVGDTVRFLPHYCMMQKVHTGVIVQAEGNKVCIEGIDLKVWAPPITR